MDKQQKIDNQNEIISNIDKDIERVNDGECID